jgi:hypothetical protein
LLKENHPALFPGRVPHVRPGVHGRKKTGRSPSNALLNKQNEQRPQSRKKPSLAQVI